MGIPFYYRHLILKDQKNLLCNLHDCDRLFLDYNSVIHTCAQDVLQTIMAKQLNEDNSMSQSHIESMIFEAVYNHTIEITKICKPTNLLYIAIDGVAPRSKIHQQRKRRYLSAFRNEMIYKFKDENNIPYIKWDSNAITPGTNFMKSLQSYLLNKFAALSTALGYKIIFSGADEPGEGEHKIIRYIKSSTTVNRDVIYGLDADLIMLSLTAANSNSNSSIYLMREGQNFMTNMTDFKFLNIANLRTTISTSIFNMYDYIFICFLLGNDFIPNVACLKIKSGAIDIICELYKETYNEIGTTLILGVTEENEKYRINYAFLISLLNKLTAREDKLMVEVTKEFYETVPVFKHFNTKLEKFTYELDNNPQYNKFPFVIDPIEDTSWRSSYYHHLFGCHKMDMVNNICKNYIEGLEWICDYYFNSHSNHKYEWYYKYNYAPCVSDLHKYLKINSEVIAMPSAPSPYSQPQSPPRITEDIQLLMVLPPLSKNILNIQQQKLMDNLDYGCVHYYPTKFCITSYLKNALWESLPVLPNIDLDHLIESHENLTRISRET